MVIVPFQGDEVKGVGEPTGRFAFQSTQQIRPTRAHTSRPTPVADSKPCALNASTP